MEDKNPQVKYHLLVGGNSKISCFYPRKIWGKWNHPIQSNFLFLPKENLGEMKSSNPIQIFIFTRKIFGGNEMIQFWRTRIFFKGVGSTNQLAGRSEPGMREGPIFGWNFPHS